LPWQLPPDTGDDELDALVKGNHAVFWQFPNKSARYRGKPVAIGVCDACGFATQTKSFPLKHFDYNDSRIPPLVDKNLEPVRPMSVKSCPDGRYKKDKICLKVR